METDYDSLEVVPKRTKRPVAYGRRAQRAARQRSALPSTTQNSPVTATSSHKQLKRNNSAVELGKRPRNEEEDEDGDAESASDEHDFSPKKILANKRARLSPAPSTHHSEPAPISEPAQPSSHHFPSPSHSPVLQPLLFPTASSSNTFPLNSQPWHKRPAASSGGRRAGRGRALSTALPENPANNSEDYGRGVTKKNKTYHSSEISAVPRILLVSPGQIDQQPSSPAKSTAADVPPASTISIDHNSAPREVQNTRSPSSRPSIQSPPTTNFGQPILSDKSNLPRTSRNARLPPSPQIVRARSASATTSVATISLGRRHASTGGFGNIFGERGRESGGGTESPRISVFRDNGVQGRRASSNRVVGSPRSNENDAPSTGLDLATLSGALPSLNDVVPPSFSQVLRQETSPSPVLVSRQSQLGGRQHSNTEFSTVSQPEQDPPASPPSEHPPSDEMHIAITDFDFDLDEEELAQVYRPPRPGSGSSIPRVGQMNSSLVLETLESPGSPTFQGLPPPYDPDVDMESFTGADPEPEEEFDDNPNIERFGDADFQSFGGGRRTPEKSSSPAPALPTSPSPPSASIHSDRPSRPILRRINTDSDDTDSDDASQPTAVSKFEWLPPRLRQPSVEVSRRGRPKLGEDELAWAIRTQKTGEDDEWNFAMLEAEIGEGMAPGRTLGKSFAASMGSRLSRMKKQLLEKVEETVGDSDDALKMRWTSSSDEESDSPAVSKFKL